MAINRLYGKQMKIDDMEELEKDKLTKKQQKELEKISNEILDQAKKIVNDYTKNPSEISGSTVRVHENSPYLDTELTSDEPLYSGSRWTKVLKSK
jgi:hypothetical protein